MTSDDYHPHMTGVGVYLKTILPELIKLGHKITLITSNNKLRTEIECTQSLNIIRVSSIKIFGFPQSLLFSKRQLQAFTEEKFDLVHHHYLSLMMNTVFLSNKNKLPQLMTYHMTAEHISQTFLTKPFKSFIKKSYMKRLSQMNMVIVPSLNHLQDLQKNYSIPNLHFLSNPNPLEILASNLDILNYKEKKYSQKNKLQLLCVSRLAPEKNIQFAIKTVHFIQQKDLDCELIIVGQGPELDSLKKLDQKLNTKVQFVGFKEPKDLKDYYLQSDFFLLPSLFENQGLVLLEAFSFGTPCIALQENISAPEMISSEKNGFILPSLPETWAEVILQTYNNKEKMLSFSQEAFSISKKYNLSEHIYQLNHIYQKSVTP